MRSIPALSCTTTGCEPRGVTVERPHARTRARRVSARHRRMLARWLRRTASHTPEPDPVRRRRELLLCDRVAAVRAELHEVALMLEHADDPDPTCVAALHRLLSDGCGSPLYNPDLHISELRATLYYLRSALSRSTIGLEQPRPPSTQRDQPRQTQTVTKRERVSPRRRLRWPRPNNDQQRPQKRD